MRNNLFRPEVLASQHESLFGDHVFYQPFSLRALVLASVACFCVLIGFSASASIKQTVSVRGYVAAVDGEIKVYANRNGVIQQLHVSNGDLVSRGQTLAFAGDAGYLQSGADAKQVSILHLEQQLTQIEDRLSLLQHRQQLALEQSQWRQEALSEELRIRDDDLQLTAQQLEMAEHDFTRLELLHARGAIADSELTQGKHALITARKSFQGGRIAKQTARRLWQDSRHELAREQAAFKDEQIALAISLSQLQLRRQEMQYEHQFAVTAPASGRISSLLLSNGDQLDTRQPLVSIIADKPHYEARMFVPSRALGKLKAGQQVLIDYDAFPLQQYGTFEAVISSVATSPIDPREYLIPLDINEPVYLVKAQLREQAKDLHLRSGMQFSAQLVTGEQTLQQTIFEPLSAIARRLQ